VGGRTLSADQLLAPVSHSATPPWCEQVPLWWVDFE
jgi:hypothetical protein